MDCYQENVDMNVTAVILSGVASALQHLHSVNIAHNDLKPENILLNMSPHDLTVKLCDLGNAWIGKPGELRIRDHVGTGGFMAPECIMEEKYWYFKCKYIAVMLCSPFAADIFSFGCVALEMIMAEVRGKICFQCLLNLGSFSVGLDGLLLFLSYGNTGAIWGKYN